MINDPILEHPKVNQIVPNIGELNNDVIQSIPKTIAGIENPTIAPIVITVYSLTIAILKIKINLIIHFYLIK